MFSLTVFWDVYFLWTIPAGFAEIRSCVSDRMQLYFLVILGSEICFFYEHDRIIALFFFQYLSGTDPDGRILFFRTVKIQFRRMDE